MRRLRIAILAHSTNPRGGVVHALALAEALTELGHEPVVHAPDPKGVGFFRETRCATCSVAASPAGGSLHDLVTTRIGDYVRHFAVAAHRDFDVFHAHDGISGNALADLADDGLIGGFARTVHHIDTFADERVAALQERSIARADRHFVVSDLWRGQLHEAFGIEATVVGNGVDRAMFAPAPTGREKGLREELRVGSGPVFLAIGGIERRKNTLNILRAFEQVHRLHPAASLVIAGGASLLDHQTYQEQFLDELARIPRAAQSVILAGPVAQENLAALYRLSDTLVFPSINEGFGLVALEALACGIPVVTSRIAPFTEHFSDGDVCWCDPHTPRSIADAMVLSLNPQVRAALASRSEAVLARHDWRDTARAHLPVYEAVNGVQYA